jgi:hypothetical protein
MAKVLYTAPNGSQLRCGPYTKAEEAELYRRMGGGPVTMAGGILREPRKNTPDKKVLRSRSSASKRRK